MTVEMESVPVIIVGAGPAGLTLGLCLAEREIQSIILEKELEITDDPRGVYLAGDAVRSLWHLGLSETVSEIGHHVAAANFHKGTLENPAFFALRTAGDVHGQTVPRGILQFQPKLERALRSRISGSQYCELRCGSEVVSRQELDDGLIVDFKDAGGEVQQIKCSWMVGADGKRGVVRKKFLEPTANIKQEVGLSSYSATWVAANLRIRLPTPETHPEFPLWEVGFTPARVYDLFWPAEWHFICPPGKPTACGRFGPFKDRYWRHEFAEPDWNDSKDATALLWQELLPLITRGTDESGRLFPRGKVVFPRDCVEILRCRPFTFCQKVVNKWFHHRSILIGDAAHVFPPFGGQGISCGIRDAEGLAWRLALLLRMPNVSPASAEKTLNTWSLERRQGVDDSTRLTMSNGDLVNGTEPWSRWCLRTVFSLLSSIPILRTTIDPVANADQAGYKSTPSGMFLPDYHGGGKLAQIYIETATSPRILSDEILNRKQTTMTLIVVGQSSPEEVKNLQTLIHMANIHTSIISDDSIVFYSPRLDTTHGRGFSKPSKYQTFFPVPQEQLEKDNAILKGYCVNSYLDRMGKRAKYVIVRPDTIIFSVAKNASELARCLELLKARLGQ